MNKVRVRYAPSPTGHLHIGNARTALFNYLFARHYQGDFILRIEDTDIERNVEGGEESQITYLKWLGIEIDESPLNPNSKYAPYRQTQRLDIYHRYANYLLEKGYAYKCFCTSIDLEEDYQRQNDEGIASTRYNRKCLGLSTSKLEEYEKEKRPYSIRLKIPNNTLLVFNDIIRGEISFNSKDIGDFVIVKANGIPTYNFAVVIDDHLMEISHVFRGEEHLSNTPKQLILYQMFDWIPPQFGHLTIIVNENHKKLSKRDNSIMQFMSQYQTAGYLAEAMTNFLALLGWTPEGNEEIFSMNELITLFDEKRLTKSPSMFDKAKLDWINNRYIKKLDEQQLIALCKPFLLQNYDLSLKNEGMISELINLFKEQLSYGSQIITLSKPFFVRPDFKELNEEQLLIMNDISVSKTINTFINELIKVELNADNLKLILKETKNITSVQGKMLFMPLRIALSGEMHGVDFTGLVLGLGKEEVLYRLKRWGNA